MNAGYSKIVLVCLAVCVSVALCTSPPPDCKKDTNAKCDVKVAAVQTDLVDTDKKSWDAVKLTGFCSDLKDLANCRLLYGLRCNWEEFTTLFNEMTTEFETIKKNLKTEVQEALPTIQTCTDLEQTLEVLKLKGEKEQENANTDIQGKLNIANSNITDYEITVKSLKEKLAAKPDCQVLEQNVADFKLSEEKLNSTVEGLEGQLKTAQDDLEAAREKAEEFKTQLKTKTDELNGKLRTAETKAEDAADKVKNFLGGSATSAFASAFMIPVIILSTIANFL